MAQKYRIYINQKVILLTESEPKKSAHYQKIDSQTFDLKIIYTWILAHKSDLFYIRCNDARLFLKQVKESVKVIEAAGGLVKNENKDLLFIYRNDKWDLPKGKIEKGETVKDAAVREVEEECSIVVSKRGEKICKTYHVYIYKDEVVLKKTHWYKMKARGQNKLKPQREEGITDVRWFKPNDIDAILVNTFPSILDVLVAMKLVTDKPALLSE
ncbi:NUDIX hydrolase [Mucilaginibacter sp. UR6-11]|uniref:NUDIX hydrolase n=1 Tax=Mucilaginibacter sp. UR6-11 TaxID=1435644 RepID=UPI001E37A0E6|nr:NUDIX domain-containing protein [Mucilaginibacter sp. UR6-11]MCC8426016.1 NUDIX domain-containing protein [Mucilaginibacter sp. UR6-11]